MVFFSSAVQFLESEQSKLEELSKKLSSREVELATDQQLTVLFKRSIMGWSASPHAFLVDMMELVAVLTFWLVKLNCMGMERVLQPCTDRQVPLKRTLRGQLSTLTILKYSLFHSPTMLVFWIYTPVQGQRVWRVVVFWVMDVVLVVVAVESILEAFAVEELNKDDEVELDDEVDVELLVEFEVEEVELQFLVELDDVVDVVDVVDVDVEDDDDDAEDDDDDVLVMVALLLAALAAELVAEALANVDDQFLIELLAAVVFELLLELAEFVELLF